MHILVLDNSHLPNLTGESIHLESLRKPDDNVESYDVWVSNELSRIFDKDSYDMIVLPYSLSSRNYMDYSGLRVAMHIRLTGDWHHTRKPILFIGCETPEFVARFSPLGDLLFTPYVFTTQDSIQNLDKWENYVANKFNLEMTDSQYSQFLEKVKVTPPANYGSHHSIANEWAALRWAEMLGIKLEGLNQNILSLLFFKYLRASLGEPQKFNSKWFKNHPEPCKMNLRPYENYKIAYIDDEYSKGWDTILKQLLQSNGLEAPATFTGFQRGQDKDQLIKEIEHFIDNNDADCYILDLRLHEDDFKKDIKNEEITGHKIAKYILSKNRANQILIFTASNKVWNLKEELLRIGASGYVIKESPEMVYDRSQTYRNFQEFQNELLHSCRQAYIKKYVEFLKNKHFPSLDNFVDLLLLDKTESKKEVLPSLLLQLVVFIEDFIKEHFEFRGGDDLYRKDSSDKIINIGHKIRFHSETDGKGFNNITEVSCSENTIQLKGKYNAYAITKDRNGNVIDITIILSALKYYYKLSEQELNFVLSAKNQRNKHVAHNGTPIEMSIKEVKELFEKVVTKILEKEYKNE